MVAASVRSEVAVDALLPDMRYGEQGVALAYAAAAERRLLRASPEMAPRHVAILAPDRGLAALARCLVAEGLGVTLCSRGESSPEVPGAVVAGAVPPREADLVIAPDQVSGAVMLRVFAPGGQVRLLELAGTEGGVAVARLAARIGKPAVAWHGDRPGSLAERLRWPLLREAVHLLDEGATPSQVDRALLAFGFRSPPFLAADAEGLPSLAASAGAWDRYSPTLDLFADAGRTGAAAGFGWYRYVPGTARPQVDPGILHILRESAMAQRLRRRQISETEIVERCLRAAVAAARLEDLPAELLDAVWNVALGFPRWRGGLLRHAGG